MIGLDAVIDGSVKLENGIIVYGKIKGDINIQGTFYNLFLDLSKKDYKVKLEIDSEDLDIELESEKLTLNPFRTNWSCSFFKREGNVDFGIAPFTFASFLQAKRIFRQNCFAGLKKHTSSGCNRWVEFGRRGTN